MEYRRLGHSGLQVSVIGLGTNNFGPRLDYPAAERVLHQAVEEGINFIETSNTYGDGQAETFIGKALHAKRDQMLFATKVVSNRGEGPNMHGGSRKHILAQVELSLRRLHSDYIDLYVRRDSSLHIATQVDWNSKECSRGQPSYLTSKGRGEHSMTEKRKAKRRC